MVEGVVTEFRPASDEKHEPELIGVATDSGVVRLTYWHYNLDGFHQDASVGGPMRKGLHVRIADVDGTIARLEIADTH